MTDHKFDIANEVGRLLEELPLGSAKIKMDVMLVLGVVPDGVLLNSPYTEGRFWLIEKLEEDLKKYTHEDLARIAARMLESLAMCKSEYANYSIGKEIELIAARDQIRTTPEKVRAVISRSARLKASKSHEDRTGRKLRLEVLARWKATQAQSRKTYKTHIAFARAMQTESFDLHERVMAQWSSRWAKQVAKGEDPAY
jgi:hypothetical protein